MGTTNVEKIIQSYITAHHLIVYLTIKNRHICNGNYC